MLEDYYNRQRCSLNTIDRKSNVIKIMFEDYSSIQDINKYKQDI